MQRTLDRDRPLALVDQLAMLPMLEKFISKRGPLSLRNAQRVIDGLSRMTVIAPDEGEV